MTIGEDESLGCPSQKTAPNPEAELISRIINISAFKRSALLTRFLLYICDRKFSGREQEITEYQIGVQALGRPDSYSPGQDNIVRNYARILRKRLEEYFAGDGRQEFLRVRIPVGGYVPVFEPNPTAEDQLPEGDPAPATSSLTSSNRALSADARRSPWRLLWFLVLAIAAVVMAWLLYHAIRPATSNDINQVFWRQVFGASHLTYFVPANSGLVMMQEITGTQIHLSDLVAGNLDEKFHNFNLAATRKGEEYGFDRVSNFTSGADLSIATRMAQLAELYNGQFRLCYPQCMNVDNFQGSTTILVGGPRANPWVEMFEPESNFQMLFPIRADGTHFDGSSFVNKHPRAGEQADYVSELNEITSRSYALISFLPNADNSGHVLMLQGQGRAGTQAAGDFILDPRRMAPILRRAREPNGSVGPFEILIQASTVGNNEVQSRIVTERFTIEKNWSKQ